jgi:hypothetical protein
MIGSAIALAIAGVWYQRSEETRALRALPPAARVGLYERTLATLKSICDPAPGRSFREFCRAQAALIIELPECDAPCRQIARRHMSLPRP